MKIFVEKQDKNKENHGEFIFYERKNIYILNLLFNIYIEIKYLAKIISTASI